MLGEVCVRVVEGGNAMDMKTIVKDNTVRFRRYRAGIAYYGVKAVVQASTLCGFW